MNGIIGPILVIAIIFVVYYVAQHMDTIGDRMKSKESVKKIDAEARLEELKLKREMIEFETKRIERQLEDQSDRKSVDVDFNVLEDKRKKKDKSRK